MNCDGAVMTIGSIDVKGFANYKNRNGPASYRRSLSRHWPLGTITRNLIGKEKPGGRLSGNPAKKVLCNGSSNTGCAGAQAMKPRNSKKLAPFIPLTRATKSTPAWQALRHGARSLYMELKGHYNTKLQNGVYLSTRKAAKEIGCATKESVCSWYHELEYYGFIFMVTGAHLGVEGHGKAAHYRLTEEWYCGKPPTRDFLNWSGERYHEQKPPSYYRRARKKQNPVLHVQDTLSDTYKTVSKPTSPNGHQAVLPVQDIEKPKTVSDVQDITSLTTPLLELDAELTPEWNINIKPIPSPGTQVTDYDLALGMGTQFVGTRH
ncbi:MAG: hypothetical protein WAK55_02925, partial [Xanthobacteraceae bacterium]